MAAALTIGRAAPGRVATLFSEGIEPEPPLTPARRQRRRAVLFRESTTRGIARHALAIAAALRPSRLRATVAALDFLIRETGIAPAGLPDPAQALAVPDGLCGLALDLSPDVMMEAYARGLAPRGLIGPATWWAPQTRRLVTPTRRPAPGGFSVTLDRDFDLTLATCARPAPGRLPITPLTPALVAAFCRLHDAGFAHAYDVCDAQGRRAAGGFGVAIGRVFVLEATFAFADGAHAAGLCALADALAAFGFVALDVTAIKPISLPATNVERAAHARLVADNLAGGRLGRWTLPPPARAALRLAA